MWWWANLGTPLLIALSYMGPAFKLVTHSVSTGRTRLRVAAHVRQNMIATMCRTDRTALGRLSQGVALGLEPSEDAIHRTIMRRPKPADIHRDSADSNTLAYLVDED